MADEAYQRPLQSSRSQSAVDPPTKQELTELVHELSRRVMGVLKHRGLVRDGPVQAQADSNEPTALDACRAGLAFGS